MRIAKRHNQFFLPTTVKINLKQLLLLLFVILVSLQYFLVYPFLSNSSNKNNTDQNDALMLQLRQEQLEKYRFTNSNNNNNETKLFFIHVGKSGGETIKWRLRVICNIRASARKRAMCHEQFSSTAGGGSSESELSKHTIGYMHCNLLRPKTSIYESTILMYSIRNPIDRVVSWFQYMNPINCLPDRPSAACNLKLDKTMYNTLSNLTWGYVLFDLCFPTINDMIQSLQNEKLVHVEDSNNNSINCSQLAIDTITGYGPPGPSNHLYFNYHYYVNKTSTLLIQSSSLAQQQQQQQERQQTPSIPNNKKKRIFVIRKENLFDDLRTIEYILGGSIQRPFEREGGTISHGNQLYPYKAILDNNLMPILCCVIPKELTIYVTLVTRALNLIDVDKITSIEELYTKCDVNTNNIPIAWSSSNKNPDDVAQVFLSQMSQKCHWDKSSTMVPMP